jgi:hypothetical protein
MFKRNSTFKALATSAVLVSMLLAGCGANPATDDEFLEEPGYEEPGYTDPGTPGYVDPGTTPGGIPGVNPGGVGGVQPGQELTASVEVLKKGFLLGKTKVKVTISNPATVPQTGTLTVTFTKKGNPTKHVKTESVSLSAGESKSMEFTGAMIGTDGANAEVVTDAPMPTTGSYGQTGSSYGQTTGGYNY